ncbi:hypothetical protein B0H14DRAFT_2607878 [Mycena olivaceomarginata]|nr:hypothetical protein B0H14DRAFT_2607878 [Mycena olivaceomarginata]
MDNDTIALQLCSNPSDPISCYARKFKLLTANRSMQIFCAVIRFLVGVYCGLCRMKLPQDGPQNMNHGNGHVAFNNVNNPSGAVADICELMANRTAKKIQPAAKETVNNSATVLEGSRKIYVHMVASINFPVSPGSQPKVSPGCITDVAKVPQGQWYDATVCFLRAQRYPDEYEEDSYLVLPSRMRDLYGEEDEDRGHGWSMSIHFDESPNMNTQPAGRRSRSAHMSGPHDASGADTLIRMDDLKSLFHRFSLQQEECHREVTQGLEAHLNSLEQRSHAPPHSAGASSAPIVLPESDEGPTGRGDLIGAALQEEADADDEVDDSKKKKPKYHTTIQSEATRRVACNQF